MVITNFRIPDSTILKPDDPEKEYSHTATLTENVKLGQLKLFCNELGFLLDYICDHNLGVKRKIFLYIGAGPGDHLLILTKMFPTIEWHLYDCRFNKDLKFIPNVKVFQRYFTEEDVAEYATLSSNEDIDLYLVSDIRDLSYDGAHWSAEQELKAMDDMKLQSDWVKAIKPKYSMLKFRLPFYEKEVVEKYGGEYVDYLAGTIYKQPWSRNKSIETRLVVDGSDIREIKYSFRKYESMMFYHNSVIRTSEFFFPLSYNLNGFKISRKLTLDNRYDSAYTITLLYEYFKRSYGDLLDSTLEKRIIKILSLITSYKQE